MQTAFITRLQLTNFRNYRSSNFSFGCSPVVLFGKNGSGKTNLLEAVSFLSPGSGLRAANLPSVNFNATYTENKENLVNETLWSIYAEVKQNEETNTIGTCLIQTTENKFKRLIKINKELAKEQGELNKILNIIWLTPQMDLLFHESASIKRRFLDRIVYSIDTHHATRVNNYQKFLRERMILLTERKMEDKWLGVLEKKIATLGTEISLMRAKAIAHLNNTLSHYEGLFPGAILTIEGEIDRQIHIETIETIENFFAHKLAENRHIDTKCGKTIFGAHRSEVRFFHRQKNMEAKLCSTGEQKALLISLVLARAEMCATLTNVFPILLLDEVVSHLDNERSKELFRKLLAMDAQYFLTGTEKSLFSSLENLSEKEVRFWNVDELKKT